MPLASMKRELGHKEQASDGTAQDGPGQILGQKLVCAVSLNEALHACMHIVLSWHCTLSLSINCQLLFFDEVCGCKHLLYLDLYYEHTCLTLCKTCRHDKL